MIKINIKIKHDKYFGKEGVYEFWLFLGLLIGAQ
jgi:hypothetical protein